MRSAAARRVNKMCLMRIAKCIRASIHCRCAVGGADKSMYVSANLREQLGALCKKIARQFDSLHFLLLPSWCVGD